MPPKKKGTSQKPAKAKTPTLINGLTAEEMSKEQIEEHLLRLREELDREREERNYFQLERDNVHTFWEIVERKLEVKNSEKFQEDDDEQFQEEIRVYKQKMKHLLCEHQNTISELKADGLDSAEVQEKQQDELKKVLLQKKQLILIDMEELEKADLIWKLELKHTEEMTSTRNNWERQLTDVTARKEENMQLDQQLLEYATKSAILEQDFQGKKHISALVENRCKFNSCLHALGNWYKTDEGNTKEIKEKFQERTKELNEEKKMLSLFQDSVLAEYRTKVKKERTNIVMRPILYSKKKDSIVNYKKSLQDLELDCTAMKQKFSSLQLERDGLYKSFSEKIQNIHDDAAVGHTLVEKKLQAMSNNLEKTQAQLHSLLSAPNMDHIGLSGVTNQILENLVFRNTTIKNLQKNYDF